ncbi:hypothetical protein BOSE127_70234 [Bosea sp. 127]|nr:hypothetical protein BOSE7B_41191 [Bosea sp. 7B]VXC90814.1 hypothetical protein BOSE127_70234 [Bosea sp. 127]
MRHRLLGAALPADDEGAVGERVEIACEPRETAGIDAANLGLEGVRPFAGVLGRTRCELQRDIAEQARDHCIVGIDQPFAAKARGFQRRKNAFDQLHVDAGVRDDLGAEQWRDIGVLAQRVAVAREKRADPALPVVDRILGGRNDIRESRGRDRAEHGIAAARHVPVQRRRKHAQRPRELAQAEALQSPLINEPQRFRHDLRAIERDHFVTLGTAPTLALLGFPHVLPGVRFDRARFCSTRRN